MARKRPVDKVRASRDGHEYHEAWTARKAMQLLWPDSNLAAIAVEGLSPPDQGSASPATVDIADITFYYGRRPTFEHASRTSIVQFKYSVANKNTDFRASQARQTIAKFSKTYCDYKKKYGEQAVQAKLDFELITNRPIYKPLLQAIEALAKGLPRKDEIERQTKQFKAASGLDGKLLAAFAAKCNFFGLSGSLPTAKNELAVLIVDWSATRDPIAAERLGKIRQMVRDKAGHAGTNQNLITRTDILAALGIGDAADLLPCRPAIPDVGRIVEREQLAEAIALVPGLSMPLLIHAAGGVGKTVFMDSLAGVLREHSEVVFFDCFGGGAYRSPEDARHLPKRGLIHITNTLAFRGLCDPILPDATDVESLIRTFRRRLVQCVSTLKRVAHERNLLLFIDAIDNAELFARERSEEPFPILILESLHHAPIPGVKLIVSCRTERKPSTHARYQEFELLPFGINETAAYLRPRLTNVSQVEINVAQARSGGNPRVLEYLVKSGRGLLDESEIDKKIELDELIQNRITQALSAAIERGYKQENIDAFLAGLAVLPPPVPLDEYASAHGMQLSEIESFAADLRPLLERTNQGLMFRDEPTETLVRNLYASSEDALRRVAANLSARQDTSVYAARALPNLLHKLDDGELLFQLAFDDRIPAKITSTMGKRNIRYARIKAAVLHAAIKRDHNCLVRLLLELSSIAAGDQRGADYILDYPDLVVAAKDMDSTRRLFETRTGWPGTRHARLAIANSLSGASEDATRHAIAADEWINHYRRADHEDRMDRSHPERSDIAAIPFFLICEGRTDSAVGFLKGWHDWYTFEACEFIFDYFQLATSLRPLSSRKLSKFVGALTDVGPLTAALSFQKLQKRMGKDLIVKLSHACKKATKLKLAESYQRHPTYQLQDGLRKASALALSLGLADEARAISLCAPHQCPGIWSFRSNFYHNDVFPFIFRTALVAAATSRKLHEKDVLPRELVPICSSINSDLVDKGFRDKVKEKLPEYLSREHDEHGAKKDPSMLSYDEKQEAERFIDQRLQPLLALTQALTHFLAASPRRVDDAFIKLLKAWEDTRKSRDTYRIQEIDNLFHMLGLETALFALWARSELKPSSVKRFLTAMHGQNVSAHTYIQIVSILAQRQALQVLAGEQAQQARTLIEAEDDVTHRASLFANLGRAMLPASIDEASCYFRHGLEQMDAIGSGDYEFTNELLLFASTMKGNELNEHNFHTLTNICELNMGEEPEKFFWGAFARGLSKAAGPRGLAKLSRWDDRSKIHLSNTLLPYLTALVDDGKIEPELALALNRLADPAEYYVCGTKEFAKAIQDKGGTTRPEIISELIKQFEDDNTDIPMETAVKVLASLAEETFGSSSETTVYLSAAHKHFAKVRDTTNDHMNYRGSPDVGTRKRVKDLDRNNRAKLKDIATATDPTDQDSLAEAIKALNELQHIWDLKGAFWASLRAKVRLKDYAQYIRNLCVQEHFNLYGKLAELKECKDSWNRSSAALDQVLKDAAIPLTRLHADDLIDDGRFSGSQLKEISDLTDVPIAELVLELIKVLARPDSSVSGAVWLAFASFIGPKADDGQSQIALKRLLDSEAARLADNVVDGAWVEGLYPEDDMQAIAGGLVWRMLGSPYAKDRWRAAHSIRCLARFGRWDIVDALVAKFIEKTAGPFQAHELPFYYLHAHLWLLIALARMALDHPKEVARYEDALLSFATEKDDPHVLMRHFSARALLACIDAGDLRVQPNVVKQLQTVDFSPHQRLQEKIRVGGGFYQARPASMPEPTFDFHLDYEFHKNDVDSLSQIFGKPCWEVKDMMSEIVHQLDPNVSGMYERDARGIRHSHNSYGMSTRSHTHGEHLGWHALFLAAGKLLNHFPVTNDWWYEDDPWGEWLGRYLLTRNDGLWLSDGTDRTPLDTTQILLEKTKGGLALTSNRDRLLQLVGLTSRVGKELVVKGFWHSADNIRVSISSTLVPPQKASQLARKLTREEPMLVWVPTYHENENDLEYLMGKKKEYTPWIVCPSGETRLDEHDPFGVPCANLRPRLSRDYATTLSLTTDEPFGRYWKSALGNVAVHAQAWGRENKYIEDGPHSGLRLCCSTSSLEQILKTHDKDLLLLISLQRTEKAGYRGASKYTHTVAVVRISKTLDLEYFKGRVNQPHNSRY